MTEYALLKDGVFVKFMYRDEQPVVATHKGYSIYPVVREKVNNATTEFFDTNVVETVEPTRYLIQTIKTDKPQAEIDALIEQYKDAELSQLEAARSIIKALGTALFEVVNDVRVLKGQQPITAAQFKSYVRGKM